MEIKKKYRGWKEGILSEDLRSVGGTMHKKGSIVRYKRFKEFDTETNRWTSNYEWHYIEQSNYNLVRGNDKLLIETDEKEDIFLQMKKEDKVNEIKILQSKLKEVGLTVAEEKRYCKLNSELTGYPEKVFSKQFSMKLDGIIKRSDKLIERINNKNKKS